jgi:hypothetical protein
MDERLQRILQSKAEFRRKLACKPVAEKLRIVEELAARARVIRDRRPTRGLGGDASRQG